MIVDDGSTDGTAAAVATEFPDAVVLRGSGNLWWAGAINVGVRHALDTRADAVLFMNNDNVVDPVAIEALVACATECPSSVVASKLLTSAGPTRSSAPGGLSTGPGRARPVSGSRRGTRVSSRAAATRPGSREARCWYHGPASTRWASSTPGPSRSGGATATSPWRVSAAGMAATCDGSSRAWNDVDTTASGVSGATTLRWAWHR